MNCRFCNHPLSFVFIDLGTAPPSNSFLSTEDLDKPETYFPLKVFVCEKCFLVQLAEYIKAEEVFSSNYVYFSSFSTTWLAHARLYVEMINQRFFFNKQSLVIEIASNDGYLLQYFKEKEIPVLGIEPTDSTAKISLNKGIPTIKQFFGSSLAKELASKNKKADLLICNNVLAHTPDINDFVEGLKITLKPQGIITAEFPHLLQLIKHKQFDTIYQEHYSYFSLHTINNIFNAHNLELFDVEELQTHGGSLRIFARHKDDVSKQVSPAIEHLFQNERSDGITSLKFYEGFEEKANSIKIKFLNFLLEQKLKGKKVCAYGAAAKGNTLINYSGIKSDIIRFVADASPYKQGKYLPGSHIHVVKEDIIRNEQPDFVVILPWNIKEEIISQLHYIRNWNGQFVIAIPELKVI